MNDEVDNEVDLDVTWKLRRRLTWMMTCFFADVELYVTAYVSIHVGPNFWAIYTTYWMTLYSIFL